MFKNVKRALFPTLLHLKPSASDAMLLIPNLRDPGSNYDGETAKGVEYRLVPVQRDLMGPHMEWECLKAGEDFNVEDVQTAVAKAMTVSFKFKSKYNKISVFMIQQKRMQKHLAEGEVAVVDLVTILPV